MQPQQNPLGPRPPFPRPLNPSGGHVRPNMNPPHIGASMRPQPMQGNQPQPVINRRVSTDFTQNIPARPINAQMAPRPGLVRPPGAHLGFRPLGSAIVSAASMPSLNQHPARPGMSSSATSTAMNPTANPQIHQTQQLPNVNGNRNFTGSIKSKQSHDFSQQSQQPLPSGFIPSSNGSHQHSLGRGPIMRPHLAQSSQSTVSPQLQPLTSQPDVQGRQAMVDQSPFPSHSNLGPAQSVPTMFTPADNQTFVPSFGAPNSNVNAFGGSSPTLNDRTSQSLNQLTNQFGSMGMGSMSSISRHFNILAGPPVVSEFENLNPCPPIALTASVSGSPHSICPLAYKRSTLQVVPQSTSLLNKSKLPFALLLTPYRNLLNPQEEPVPVIQPEMIVRCRRCRTYINPWVQFIDQGARWKCNLCYLPNDVPAFFDFDSETRKGVDRLQRPELTHSVVEFIAPQEYMVRPPQPVVFLFLIDVSFAAVQSGMVQVAAKTILNNLNKIPNTDSRTKVGFIGVDNALHFFNLSPFLSEPQILVVPDLEDVFLPLPYDLLVSLSESKAVIENFLEKLPTLFRSTQITENCLGKALQFAYKMISPIGGKIIVMNAMIPNVSEGALKQREDPKLLGTSKESQLLQPFLPYYKNFAVDCSRAQVSMDVFLFGSQYNDVATLSGCAKFTGGSVYYYPGFNAARVEDAVKFSTEFSHFLSRAIGLEAVLRVRASKGIRMTSYHGNFFLRSTDLLALPNVSPDQSFAVEMTVEENLVGSIACFQTALLHTSSNGERRIRVITMALPISQNLAEVFAHADPYAMSALLAKKAVERSLTTKMEDSREAIQYKLNEILSAYKCNFTTSAQATQVCISENLKLLPILILALLKHVSLRTSASVPTDLRSYMMTLIYSLPVEMLIPSLHPNFYALHSLDPQAGLPDEYGSILLPPLLNLSSEKLERQGLFLLENGYEIFIWVGKMVSPELIQMLFNKPVYDAIITGKTIIPRMNNNFNVRVNNIIQKIRETRLAMASAFPHVYVVKEDGEPSLRAWFLSHLVEDRMETLSSYPQFLGLLREQLSKA